MSRVGQTRMAVSLGSRTRTHDGSVEASRKQVSRRSQGLASQESTQVGGTRATGHSKGGKGSESRTGHEVAPTRRGGGSSPVDQQHQALLTHGSTLYLLC